MQRHKFQRPLDKVANHVAYTGGSSKFSVAAHFFTSPFAIYSVTEVCSLAEVYTITDQLKITNILWRTGYHFLSSYRLECSQTLNGYVTSRVLLRKMQINENSFQYFNFKVNKFFPHSLFIFLLWVLVLWNCIAMFISREENIYLSMNSLKVICFTCNSYSSFAKSFVRSVFIGLNILLEEGWWL
jgi:hypothetical protein